MRRLLLLACALASCAAAWGQSPPHAEVMQKALFVKRMLEAAPSGNRADADAAALHVRALQHLERGEDREADRLLREAIRAIQLARRPSPATSQYASLVSSVETMRDTYVRYAGTKRDLHGTLVFEVNQALAQARELRSADPGEALRVLGIAEQALTYTLTHALDPLTVSYAPSFSGPQEEFRFEEARYRTYAALVPAALNQLKPGTAALLLVQRHVDSGEARAARASQLAGNGDWRAALDSVREATVSAQRALGAAGLAVPEETSR
jgi:hypothetical protein